MSARTPQRGVSLIEALVALAVMAVGMLGLVGVQSTLRGNSDVSRQRAEAVRLAHHAIEDQRSYSLLVTDTSNPAYLSYDQIAPITSEPIADPDAVNGFIYNTTFTRKRTVNTLTSSVPGGQSESKSVGVTVSWTDRSNQPQWVTLSSLITKVAPDLPATLSVPADGNPTRQPLGRNRGIPPLALDLRDGTSGLIPPGAPAGVAWRFDNASALITLCTTSAASTAALTTANITCGSSYAVLLQGYVRYQVNPTQTQANVNAAAANPTSPRPAALTSLIVRVHQTLPNTLIGWVDCFMDYQTVASPLAFYTSYYCAMPVIFVPNTAPPTWSADAATLQLAAQPPSAVPGPPFAATLAEVDPAQYKVCRYWNPVDYNNISTPQVNRNYLVINAGDGTTPLACPPPTNVPPTWPHYPTS